MDMTGQRRIPASRAQVWAALNDTEALKAAIPGCKSLERFGEDQFRAVVAVRLGPISTSFSGEVTLLNLNPPASYRIEGSGQGGPAGYAKGGADVVLTDEADGATLLSYTVAAEIGGKLAQLGARLIDASARQLADQFFDRFSTRLAASLAAPVTPQAEAPALVNDLSLAPARHALAPIFWIGAVLFLLIIVMIFGG